MKNKLIASLLAASIVSIAAPAFASGLGPAPFYNPGAGAPSSQRGPGNVQAAATGAHAFGGSVDGHAESGARSATKKLNTVFTQH